jgi:hypothetical protein
MSLKTLSKRKNFGNYIFLRNILDKNIHSKCNRVQNNKEAMSSCKNETKEIIIIIIIIIIIKTPFRKYTFEQTPVEYLEASLFYF